MIQIKNLSKNFRTEEVETIALNGISIHRHHGTQRMRQINPAAYSRPAR